MKQSKRFLPFLYFLFLMGCSKSTNSLPDHDATGPTGGGSDSSCSAKPADVEGIEIFPADNSWNQDISGIAADANSAKYLANYATTGLHPDFGSGLWDNAPIGIPFVVVCGGQKKIPVVFRANSYDDNYGDESDPGPYPIPLNAPIEGNGQGDSHVIAVDKENELLYELYNASVNGDHWEASSGAIFNLRSDQFRTDGWTSADAAGLPILPGLVRYQEILNGVIAHPIRFTLVKSNVAPTYISPARHKVNGTGGTYGLPFGAKIRLKASFDISGYPPHVQVILKAMKKYGLILADIGSNMYVSGAPDERWDNDELQQLGKVKASDFEVIPFK